ncbi:hypothetical protein [Streptomyces sp. NPDC088725]|uniref:hypothetical protein n=1 Tax=Streptomyces sp. NPDC088725 TaxID=3365873 RepID=UPI0038286FD3
MTAPTRHEAPSDYRMLVPRDWFRIDLTQERWRPQLKTFMDQQSAGKDVPAETKREIWATLRNLAEAGVAHGALELFLRTDSPGGAPYPATLLISLLHAPDGEPAAPQRLAEVLADRRGETAEVSVVTLPAGETVRVLTDTTMDFHVHMPGDVGYLMLSFSIPLSGTTGPMARLCESMAHSLRWI